MARYKLRYIDPNDGANFFGEVIDSNVLPEKGDIHTINGKKYAVTRTPKEPKVKAGNPEPLEVHVRVKEQLPLPRIGIIRG